MSDVEVLAKLIRDARVARDNQVRSETLLDVVTGIRKGMCSRGFVSPDLVALADTLESEAERWSQQ